MFNSSKNRMSDYVVKNNGFDPNQPRDSKGQWTDNGSGTTFDRKIKIPNKVDSPHTMSDLKSRQSEWEDDPNWDKTQYSKKALWKNYVRDERNDDSRYKSMDKHIDNMLSFIDKSKAKQPQVIIRENKDGDMVFSMTIDKQCKAGILCSMKRNDDGDMVFDVGHIQIPKGLQGKGLGEQFMKEAVLMAKDCGADRLSFEAGWKITPNIPGLGLDSSKDMWGFYTWAKMGFSDPKGNVSKTINEKGLDWWKKNGNAFFVDMPITDAVNIVKGY